MAHLKRFYSDSAAPGGIIILDQAQSNHLKNVLRLKLGSTVEVFNNRNESYIAEIASISPKSPVKLKILSLVVANHSVSRIPHPVSPNITLACAIAKGSRMDWLVEKSAEIGMARLIPIITERTVVKPDAASKNKIARWHKLAVVAAKQTGQNAVLAIDNPIPFNQLTNIITNFSLSLIAVPNADKYLPEVLKKANLTGGNKILYLVGPEGDFTREEVAAAIKWGVQPVRLPVNSILRVETAAITMLGMLLYHFTSN
ncbi:MAG: 16S rRNA (uracil(1498)-N(3))-methyltransferase [Planctomycetes bacterium]|nr:16S rRNA (uracil(1498)-N(3))-methyltransferase [Planctomycetota bacterium]